MKGRYNIKLIPYSLEFSFKVITSRGRMPNHRVIFLGIHDSKRNCWGWGEINVLNGLSTDSEVNYMEYASKLEEWIEDIDVGESSEIILAEIGKKIPKVYSSLIMATETALLELKSGIMGKIFGNDRKPIKINGLVWMGNSEMVLRQITEKIRDGFTCIKVKVGGLHFEDELDILEYVRRKYYKENITIRLDANGAFSGKNPLDKLNALKKYKIHSIEQPVNPNDPELKEVIKNSPIPVALDESLIGIFDANKKIDLLDQLLPEYIVLKPSLHGGFYSCMEWIDLAEKRNISWWITSALETNIGLNAIADFTNGYKNSLYQGLGTGKIYENNIPSPLLIKGEELIITEKRNWDLIFLKDG